MLRDPVASIRVVKVDLYGALRKLEPPADLFVGESLCNQHHDLSLSAGQRLSELLGDRLASDLMLERCIDEGGRESLAISGHSPNTPSEVAERRLLEHDPFGTTSNGVQNFPVAHCR